MPDPATLATAGLGATELSPQQIALAAAIIFTGSSIKGVFGFGDALFAMPLLLLFLDPTLATPTIAITGLAMSIGIAWQTWHEIAWASAARLVLAGLLGVPLGVLTLNHVDATLIRKGLGVIVIAYASWDLLRPDSPRSVHRGWAWPFGLLAGWLGAAVNTPGPAVILYAALRRWEPDQLRGTLQAFFLPIAVVVVIGHGVGGLWTPDVALLSLIGVPLAIIATAIGHRVALRVPPARFRSTLLIVLIALGGLLLWR